MVDRGGLEPHALIAYAHLEENPDGFPLKLPFESRDMLILIPLANSYEAKNESILAK